MMPFYYEYSKVINVLGDIGTSDTLQALEDFREKYPSLLKERVDGAIARINSAGGVS